MSTGEWATDPELDAALARAIRHLIADAIEAGANAGIETGTTGSAAAVA
jgi:hypothetical protein